MPAFRIPRASVEVEVSRLEAQGYRLHTVVPDGDDVIGFADPLWRGAAPCQRPPSVETRNIVERPEWFVEAGGAA